MVIQLQKHCIGEVQATKYIQADESVGNGRKKKIIDGGLLKDNFV